MLSIRLAVPRSILLRHIIAKTYENCFCYSGMPGLGLVYIDASLITRRAELVPARTAALRLNLGSRLIGQVRKHRNVRRLSPEVIGSGTHCGSPAVRLLNRSSSARLTISASLSVG